MTTPTVSPVVLSDGRLEIGKDPLSAAEARSVRDFITQHLSSLESAAAEREAVAKAMLELGRGMRDSLPQPLSFGSTARGRVTATMGTAAEVDLWAAHLGSPASDDTRNDGAEQRRAVVSGALVVATAWQAVTP